jgi:uncharacterized protein YndB with AHSA1/START domain
MSCHVGLNCSRLGKEKPLMPEILHQLRVNTPAERVYAALTQQTGLASWGTRDTTAEPTLGSTAQFGFNNRQIIFRMLIETLRPNKHVQWRCLGDHPEWTDTEVIFELTADADGTTLRFSHRKWKSSDGMLARCSYDWARYLTSLKSYLETGTGMPHSG